MAQAYDEAVAIGEDYAAKARDKLDDAQVLVEFIKDARALAPELDFGEVRCVDAPEIPRDAAEIPMDSLIARKTRMHRAQVAFIYDPTFSLDPGQFTIDNPDFGEIPGFYFQTDVDEALQEVRADSGRATRSEMSRTPIRARSCAALRASPCSRPRPPPRAFLVRRRSIMRKRSWLRLRMNISRLCRLSRTRISSMTTIRRTSMRARFYRARRRHGSSRHFRVISADMWHALSNFTPHPRRAERTLEGREGGHVRLSRRSHAR